MNNEFNELRKCCEINGPFIKVGEGAEGDLVISTGLEKCSTIGG